MTLHNQSSKQTGEEGEIDPTLSPLCAFCIHILLYILWVCCMEISEGILPFNIEAYRSLPLLHIIHHITKPFLISFGFILDHLINIYLGYHILNLFNYVDVSLICQNQSRVIYWR